MRKKTIIIIIYLVVALLFFSASIYSLYFRFSNPSLTETEFFLKIWFVPIAYLITIITIKLLQKWREKK